MGKINKSDLGYLGEDFQFKLVKYFMEDLSFFREIYSIVDQNMFTQPYLRVFVGVMKEYYINNDVVPSYSTMSIALASKSKTDIDKETFEATIQKIKNSSTEGCEFIRDLANKFFRQQNLVKVANEILKIAGDGDVSQYDRCAELIEAAVNVGANEEFGVSPYDIIDDALSPSFKVFVPTGISKLDDVMNGGLEKGKMGLIIGSAGFGKTTMTTALAGYAATCRTEANDYNGFKVLQIFFEDDAVDIARKHFSKITQVEARNLTTDEDTAASIKDVLEKFPDKDLIKQNLRLKRFPTGEKTATDIKLYIKRLINTGFKPDLVILDYFECLASEHARYNNESEWNQEGRTMRKLETMAHELNIALWLPTQGNKDSIKDSANNQLVTMDKAGGSIKKVQIAQVVISIARSMSDIDNNRANLAILKNRSGKSGPVFENIRFNNGTSTIDCDDVIEYNDALVFHEKERERKAIQTFELGKQVFNEMKRNEFSNSENEFSLTDFS